MQRSIEVQNSAPQHSTAMQYKWVGGDEGVCLLCVYGGGKGASGELGGNAGREAVQPSRP